MAYFLRKTKRKNGDIYYQIYDSYYSLDKHKNKNKSVSVLGLLSELKKENETQDDVEKRLKEIVIQKENERIKSSSKQITDDEEIFNYGYYLLENLTDYLNVKKQIDFLSLGTNFKFNLSDILFQLANARVIDPCSKYKTFADVFPKMFYNPTEKISINQMYSGLSYLGTVSQDVIDILNGQINKIFKRDLSTVYFDCTNYYFEIDCESGLKMKGPSKEKRTDPIVGMALLLDHDLLPYQMEVFPGNESEKPHLPKSILKVREEKGKKTKIIQVADKGLNCAENIYKCKENDGYIFSKSLKMMKTEDIQWVFEDEGWVDVKDDNGNLLFSYKSMIYAVEYEFKDNNGKPVKFTKEEKRLATFNPDLQKKQSIEFTKQYNKVVNKTSNARIKEIVGGRNGKYVLNTICDKKTGEVLNNAELSIDVDKQKLNEDLKLAGYNLLVTSELEMDDREIYNVYHQLWNIEKTFRLMKTQLDSRPVYVSKDDAIRGHFLTCYTAILLLRLLEKKVFNNKFTIEEIIDYIRKAYVVKLDDDNYFNILKRKDAKISEYMQDIVGLKLLNKTMTKNNISSFFNSKKMPIETKSK